MGRSLVGDVLPDQAGHGDDEHLRPGGSAAARGDPAPAAAAPGAGAASTAAAAASRPQTAARHRFIDGPSRSRYSSSVASTSASAPHTCVDGRPTGLGHALPRRRGRRGARRPRRPAPGRRRRARSARSPPPGSPPAPGPPVWPRRAGRAPAPRPARAVPTPRRRGWPRRRPRRARRERCRSARPGGRCRRGPGRRIWSVSSPASGPSPTIGDPHVRRPPDEERGGLDQGRRGPSAGAGGRRRRRATARRRRRGGPGPRRGAPGLGRRAEGPDHPDGPGGVLLHVAPDLGRDGHQRVGPLEHPALQHAHDPGRPAARLVEDDVVHGHHHRRPVAPGAGAHHGEPPGLEAVGVHEVDAAAGPGAAAASAVARRPGDRLDGMATTSSRGRMPSMTPGRPGQRRPANPAPRARPPAHRRAGGCRPSRDRAPAGSSCRRPARRRRRPAGASRPSPRRPPPHGRDLRHCALRAGCATNARGRGQGQGEDDRARQATDAPAPPAHRPGPSHRAPGSTAIMATPATAAMARPATIPRAHARPPQLGQRPLRDDGEDDRADQVRASVRRGQRRGPLAVGRQHRAHDHGHEPGHGDQAVGQRRAADVALRVAHPGEQEEQAVADEPRREGGDGVGQRRRRRRRRPRRTRSAGRAATPAPGGRRWPARSRPRSSPPRRPPARASRSLRPGQHGAGHGREARRGHRDGDERVRQLEEGEREREPGHRPARRRCRARGRPGSAAGSAPGRRRPTRPAGPAGRPRGRGASRGRHRTPVGAGGHARARR